ncbi:MAG TPA: cytochrome P450 [Herpetosiphonaceae bacterium]
MTTQLPGPTGLPGIGSLLAFQRHPISFLVDLEHRFGSPCQFRLGSTPVVFAGDTASIRTILVDQARIFRQVYGPLKQVIGTSLITVDGEAHGQQRRLLQPFFSRRQVAKYTELMQRATHEMMQDWHSGQQIEISRATHHLALYIIGRVLFGDIDLRDRQLALSQGLDGIFSYIANLIGVHAIKNLPLRVPGTPYHRLQQAIPTIHRAVDERIEFQQRATPSGIDMLTQLTQVLDDQNQSLSTRAIRDQLLGLLLAGHETIATVLTWTLFLLARHPSIQEALRNQIQDVAGTQPPDHDVLDRIPLLQHVIKESLRLYPPAWHIAKRTSETFRIGDYLLNVAQTKILVMLSPYVTHRLPTYWTEPTRFDPERFSRGEPSQPLAYFPFGAGERMCIGMTFALLEVRLVLAMLLQKFRFQLVSNPSLAIAYSPTLHLRQLKLVLEA